MSQIVHYAASVNASGGISALCYRRKRAINLGRATWTLRSESVTCRKCKQRIAELQPHVPGGHSL